MQFTVDKEIERVMNGLQEMFDVYDNAQVIRKSLALARVAASHADKNGVVTISGDGDPVELRLRG